MDSDKDPRTACSACLPGQHAPHSGSAECVECAPGSYSNDAGQPECTACGRGNELLPDGPLHDKRVSDYISYFPSSLTCPQVFAVPTFNCQYDLTPFGHPGVTLGEVCPVMCKGKRMRWGAGWWWNTSENCAQTNYARV